MIQELFAIANCNKGWAAERAIIALQIHEALQTGNIHPDEARELLQDLIRTDKLDAEADDMETKAVLVAGIYGILQII